jgi:hypothetical protein
MHMSPAGPPVMEFMASRRYSDFRFFHGGNRGSNPLGDANDINTLGRSNSRDIRLSVSFR